MPLPLWPALALLMWIYSSKPWPTVLSWAGLTRQQALTYAAQTVMGSAAMILQSGKHPGVLKDEVCSPAGSTIAGVAVLEQHSFRYASMEAVMAAYRKNIDLGKR